jgi:hypothetical protein
VQVDGLGKLGRPAITQILRSKPRRHWEKGRITGAGGEFRAGGRESVYGARRRVLVWIHRTGAETEQIDEHRFTILEGGRFQ